MLRKRAAEIETTKKKSSTNKKLVALSTSIGSIRKAVELATNLRESDAQAFADELDSVVLSTPQATADKQLELFCREAPDVPSYASNYILSCFSYAYFARKYLAHHFTAGFSKRFHGELFPMLRAAECHTTRTPVVVIGWRESGKSTCCTLLLPIHATVFPHHIYHADGTMIDLSKRFIIFIGATVPFGRKALNNVLDEFQTNEDLRRDFGEFYRDPSTAFGRQPEWNKNAAVTTNGVRLEAFGRTSKLRTIKWHEHRPDLALGDDLEDDKSIQSRDRRAEDLHYFTQILTPSLKYENGNAVLCGNDLHPQGLLAKLLEYGKNNGWLVRRFKAYEIDPDTGEKVYSFPERFGPEWEKDVRKRMMDNPAAFDAEYLQTPNSGTLQLSDEDFEYYSMDTLTQRLPYCRIYVGVDPSSGETVRGDFTAITPIAFDRHTGLIYVLPCYHARIGVAGQVTAIIDTYVKWHANVIGIEAVAYQKVLKPLVDEEARRHGMSIPTTEVSQSRAGDKRLRISRLFKPIKDKTILFLRNDATHVTLKNELIYINTTDYDDLADSLEIAVRLKDKEVEQTYKQYGTVSAFIG